MKSLRLVLGSVIVYVAVAILHACGSAGPMLTPSGSGGHGGSFTSAGGKGGATTSGGGHVGHGGMGGTGGVMNPVGDADAEESGSRIKALRYVGDDGSKQFAGWYDTSLKVKCAWSRATDGVTRCVPLDPTGLASLAGFSDSSCTKNLSAMATCLSVMQPPYALSAYDQSMCGVYGVYHVYPVIQPHVGPVYAQSGTSCVQTSTTGYAFYDIGPEMPSSSFVGSTTAQDQ